MHGWCNPEDEGQLVGHEWTIESTRDFGVGGPILGSAKYYFYTEEDMVGRTYQVDQRDENAVTYFRTETDYTTIDWATNPDYPDGVRFIYANETRQYERQDAVLRLVVRTEYDYDSDWGDMTAQRLYDGAGEEDLVRGTAYTYLRNVAPPATYLIGFLRSSTTTDAASTVIEQTFYAYDDTGSSLGTIGALTLQQTCTLESGACTTQSGQTIDTTFGYDIYGNLTEARAHGAYGTLGSQPTDNNSIDRYTTTAYDTIYHAYPVSVTNPLGHTVETEYDFQLTGEAPLGLPRFTTDTNGAETEIVYDDLGRVVEVYQPGASQANVVTVFPTLNQDNEIDAPYTIELQIWDDGGPGGDQYRHAWAFYDGLGRILRTVGPAEDAGQYIQTDVSFNAMGLVDRTARAYEVTLATPPGTWAAPNWAARDVTEVDYDAFGRAVLVTAPDGATVQTQYNGRQTTVVDPNGHRRRSIVDDLGRLVEVREYEGTGAAGDPYTLYATTTYAYDSRDLLMTVTDAHDNETTITYDALGRKVGMDDPDMGAWAYEYDIWGQLTLQTDARGAQVRFEYDQLGRATLRQARMSAQESWATVASYTYDNTTGGNYGLGRLTGMSSVYESGSPTVVDAMTYDLLGRAVETTRTVDETDYTTTATYDSIGRVLTTTLPTGETVTSSYNARGLFESLAGTDTYVSATDYTPTGDVDDQTLGNSVMTNFTYEDESNRLQRIFTGRPGYLPLVDLTYAYDDAGSVIEIDDGVQDEVRGFEYDALDRLIFADVYAGTQMIEERYYTYDELGNMLSFRHRLPSASEGRGAFGVGGGAAGTSYQTRASFSGTTGHDLDSETYSGAGIMPYVRGFGGGGAAGGYATRGSTTSGGEQAESESYSGAAGFNAMGGLSEAGLYEGRGVTAYVRGIAGGFGGWEGEEYSGPTGQTLDEYTYGENGAGPHAVTSLSDGSAFAYDANGNMIQRVQDGVTWTYTFDAENQLVQVSDGGTVTTMVYDGSGARIERVVDDGATVTTTLYVAGMEIESVGGVESQRTVYYGAGGAFRIIGGEDAGLYFRHSDHLGSTSVLSDSSGNRVEGSDVVYAPFGEVRIGEQSELTDFGFTGQRLDESTGGLMYYGARYYLPSLRRFISADTIVPGAGNPQNLNRYSYVTNNPINLIDPTGHRIEDDPYFHAVNPNPVPIPSDPPPGSTSSEPEPGAADPCSGLGTSAAGCHPGRTSPEELERIRRDTFGGQNIRTYALTIVRQSEMHGIPIDLLAAIIRHESAALERTLTVSPVLDLDYLGARILGRDRQSLGLGQIQVATAESLENMGYVSVSESRAERIARLSGPETNIEYAAANLHYLQDQLRETCSETPALCGGTSFDSLDHNTQTGLLAAGYNMGWEGLRGILEDDELGMDYAIEIHHYAAQQIVPFLGWSEEQVWIGLGQ